MELCPACDSDEVTIEPGLDVFPYGLHPDTVMLTARVDFYHCGFCGLTYTGYQGELAREQAVKEWVEHGVRLG